MKKDNSELISLICCSIVAGGCAGKLLWDTFRGSLKFIQVLCALVWSSLFYVTLLSYCRGRRKEKA